MPDVCAICHSDLNVFLGSALELLGDYGISDRSGAESESGKGLPCCFV